MLTAMKNAKKKRDPESSEDAADIDAPSSDNATDQIVKLVIEPNAIVTELNSNATSKTVYPAEHSKDPKS